MNVRGMWSSKAVFCGALLLPAAVESGASAQEVCFPTPISVPYLSGAPTWYSGGLFNRRTDLNEPRWGASVPAVFYNDQGNQAVSEGHFRIVRSGTNLHFSFQNKADNTPSSEDLVFLAIEVPGSGRRVAAVLPVNRGSSDPSTSTSDVADYRYTMEGAETSASWKKRLAVPSWIDTGSIGTWTRQPVSDGGADWAVQWVVKAGDLGIGDATDFKLFMGMAKAIEGSLNPDGTTNSVVVTAPAKDRGVTTVLDTPIPADINIWLSTQAPEGHPLRLRKLGDPCPDGIAFTSSLQIGTTHPNSHEINYTQNCQRPGGGTVPCTNTFFAEPSANGVTAGPGTLQARFRIADWGAQLDQRYADDWLQLPGAEAIQNVAGGTRFEHTCENRNGQVCVVGATGLAVPADKHQCMIVELSPTPGNDIPIRTPIVYRNMRFEQLSERRIDAKISLAGLFAQTGLTGDRDVIMSVVTRNMPKLGNWPMFLDSELLNWLKLIAQGLINELNPFGANVTAEDQMKMVWPTYEVHSYFDTGSTFTRNGKKYRELSPMVSFGYYFSHNGIFYGYTHALGGAGVTEYAQAPSVYKVRVSEDVPVKITSGVRTEDFPAILVNTVNLACRIFPFCAPRG